MKPERRPIGEAASPLVIVDGISGDVGAVVELAAALAPFPPVRHGYYPGLRRVITDADGAAMAYVTRTLEAAAPYIGGGFDVDRFDVIEASFSIVTAPPGTLSPAQRAPHFDSVDPDYLAVMHYLTDTPGTAFYRQRATGIERVTRANEAAFVAEARRASAALAGYTNASNAAFEQIALVEGVADRLAVYPGCQLHSGIIADDADLSPDPRRGRLTANLFIQARR